MRGSLQLWYLSIKLCLVCFAPLCLHHSLFLSCRSPWVFIFILFPLLEIKQQSSHHFTFKNTTDIWRLLLSSHKSSIKSMLSHSILSPRRVWRVAQKLHVTVKQRRMKGGFQKSGGQRLSCFGGDNLWAISVPPSECGNFFQKSAQL